MSDTERMRSEYPFKRLEPSKAPAQVEVAAFDRTDDKSGAGSPPSRIPARFAAREKAAAIDDPRASSGPAQRMLYEHAGRGATSRVVLEDTVARARRRPNKSNLEQMRFVANEVGRRRGGGRLLREMITQDLVDELIGVEGDEQVERER